GRRIVFTKDELRVLKECNNESFYYRCLPLGVLFIGTTQLLTNRGILKPNKKFGALFKNMAAGLAAFLLGKLTYQGTCREKIMQLQDSPMADALRKGKWGTEVVQDMLVSSVVSMYVIKYM
ncbi:hypothetical protein HELRODRAFT_91145, partial [Helobdella robusta]|uniref:OCIA domain-containing protein n=1 Tax=Helobdella robusta TaxID=6412 RepID=T1G802_HELRO